MLAEGFTTRRGRRGGATCTTTPSTAAARPPRRAARRRSPPAARSPTSPTTASCSSPTTPSSARSTRTSPSRASPGDIFQLGNTSWRILRVEPGTRAGRGCARRSRPTIPFWLGEAPARSDGAVGGRVATCAREVDERLASRVRAASAVTRGSRDETAASSARRRRADRRLPGATPTRCSATMPTQETLVLERFFDESGGMQLVIHAPFGSRINRAWGLALRKRFCRQLQLRAAGRRDRGRASCSRSARSTASRWTTSSASSSPRPCATCSSRRCSTRRCSACAGAGTRRARWPSRARAAAGRSRRRSSACSAEDLLAAVFPDAAACLENIAGRSRGPRPPAGASDGAATACTRRWTSTALTAMLERIESGEVRVVARDTAGAVAAGRTRSSTRGPTRSSTMRRWRSGGPRRSTPGAPTSRPMPRISVRSTRRPSRASGTRRGPISETPDELHDALLTSGFLNQAEIAGGRDGVSWTPLVERASRVGAVARRNRAGRCRSGGRHGAARRIAGAPRRGRGA